MAQQDHTGDFLQSILAQSWMVWADSARLRYGSVEMNRALDQLRPISITRHFTSTAAGSVLWKQGNTVLLCTASVVAGVPPWFGSRNVGGWMTAEYTMLPGSTPTRKAWPRTGHTDSRGTEIQRLIGRALRATIDPRKIGSNTIHIDCHVLQADGGTRTAAICGGFLALRDAVRAMPTQLPPRPAPTDATTTPSETERNYDPHQAIVDPVAAVSVGIIDNQAVLDLDYELDVKANVDLNVACTMAGKYVEIQAAAENGIGYTHDQLLAMLALGRKGCAELLKIMSDA